MSWLVQARLVNGPSNDPGLFVDFRFGRRALLLDLGDISPLSAREMLRVTDVFVSHAHMDHFAGFDRLLRLRLHRPEPLRIVGPPGFADRVEHRLAAYTWNLLGEESPDFVIRVAEFDGARISAAAEFRARRRFLREPAETPRLPDGMVLAEDQFRVEAALLDHGTPCLAFALQESLRVNVWKEGLAALGLEVGSWLNQAKRLVRAGAPDDHALAAAGGTVVTVGELKERALRVGPGQRIAYVTDAVFHEANAAKTIALARGADHLFIEAAFLDEDAEIARERMHLKAAQAGRMARDAGVARVTPFHFSPRYLDRGEALRRELDQAFTRG